MTDWIGLIFSDITSTLLKLNVLRIMWWPPVWYYQIFVWIFPSLHNWFKWSDLTFQEINYRNQSLIHFSMRRNPSKILIQKNNSIFFFEKLTSSGLLQVLQYLIELHIISIWETLAKKTDVCNKTVSIFVTWYSKKKICLWFYAKVHKKLIS